MKLYLALLAALCSVLAVSGQSIAMAGDNRIYAEDDGTVALMQMEDEDAISYRFDSSGSKIFEFDDDNASIGYFVFNLTGLNLVESDNLVLLKVFADDPESFDNEMIATTNIFQVLQEGNAASGLIIAQNSDWSDPYLGKGFAVFDLTKKIRLLNLHNQTSVMFLLGGENLTMGTIESGEPAQIILV